ncbi:multiple epidermal growth factor-like domains protein 11 [Magallana gigas]|uniref:multiple epidermal growth factor-like domains protein 11 n=1 Tax=Magallana gigas TaxID=29159 RepID=UPI00333F2BA7
MTMTGKCCQNSTVYGSNCDRPCPINCKDNTCHIQLGHCFACPPGWTGNSCITKCIEGWYGSNCSQQCVGHCRSGKTCNHVTGQCDRGCDAGWTGYFCNKECEVGEYGFDCVNTCSGHCFGDSPCNKQTGHCERGCKVGYINSDCGTKCPSGNFGMDCKELCPGHCLNNETCDHVSGLCLNGCHDGYIGKYCNISCQEGYYGKNCSMVCHPNCTTCRNTDGFCTCGAGWIGPNCSLECVWSYGGHCQYPCSRHCRNQTCDRFNGSCLLGYSNEYMYCESADSQQSPTTLTISIAGFTVSLVLNIIVISAIMLRRRKKSFNWNNIQCCLKTTFKTKQNKTEDEEPHYQELKERKNENNYQNLT